MYMQVSLKHTRGRKFKTVNVTSKPRVLFTKHSPPNEFVCQFIYVKYVRLHKQTQREERGGEGIVNTDQDLDTKASSLVHHIYDSFGCIQTSVFKKTKWDILTNILIQGFYRNLQTINLNIQERIFQVISLEQQYRRFYDYTKLFFISSMIYLEFTSRRLEVQV